MRFVHGLSLILSVLILLPPAASAMELYPSREKNFAYLIANGPIVIQDISKLKQILEFNALKKTPTAIMLTSPGGALEILKTLTDVILNASDKLYKSTGRPNLIVINEECSSACAVLTTMLTHRRDARSLAFMISPSAKFGLHAGAIGTIMDGRFVEDKTPGSREEAVENQLNALKESGINPDWLEKHESVFRNPDFTNFSAKELCASNSLIVPTDACLPDDGDVLPLIASRLNPPTPRKR